MTTVEFLSYLRDMDVRLWVDGDKLRYNARDGSLTASLRTEIIERKAEILAFLRQTRAAIDSTSSPIRSISRDEVLPLSFAQARLWFLHQLNLGSSSYNISAAVRLNGSLHAAILSQTLNEIVRRHESLRTTFNMVNSEPIQVFDKPSQQFLPMVDLSGLSDSRREDLVRRLATCDSQRPFDLTREQPLRGTLLRERFGEYVVLFVMHHIVSDGWSMSVLIQEVSTLYEIFGTGVPSSLSDLPFQYADFAYWQRQHLTGEVLEALLSYWKQQLAGSPSVLQLPTDQSRPATQTFRGTSQSFSLSFDLSKKLKILSRQEECTLFITLLSAFATLLSRYTGQVDIVVAAPIANRNRQEIEGLIGLFVNTLIFRTNLSGNPSFRELLGRAYQMSLGAYAHQDLPFEKLVEVLQPERNLSYNPLVQVMFGFQNTPRQVLELPDLKMEFIESNTSAVKYDLALLIAEKENRLSASLEYNTDLFKDITVTRMLGHFRTLVKSIVTDPEQRLSNLSFLTAAEQHQLLETWNDTQKNYPMNSCIHQLIEVQVQRTPDAIALIFEEEKLTYQELNYRANQLAHHLVRLGVESEVLVGICMERSVEMVVGLLGILKAGGAYVPLDPTYPPERLAFMLNDADISVLMTQQRLLTVLPEHEIPVVCLDSDWGSIAQECRENPTSKVTKDNLAYVIYTSGSTGKPKGVMNTHYGINNRLLWMQDTYQLTAADYVLQKTPFSFDVSVWEFFCPLLTGAHLVVAKPEGHKDSGYLVKLICEQRVTILHFVPPMLQIFLEEEGLEVCGSLKRVFCSGEALSFELQERFFFRLNAELHNLYGPTEAAIEVTYWACKRDIHQEIVPIGRPISNTQIYILDKYLQPMPIGVPGELHIGGTGLARGYLNQPALTAEKFIQNPFIKDSHTRLYKTGDLVRYLSDGNIEFLGRLDHQVKIRGFRIELGEIETVLNQHPAVQETVILAQEVNSTDKDIVAYLVLHKGCSLTINNLRDFLNQKLPEYMTPRFFVFLDVLPLTPNGKVNRRALPAPDRVRPELEEAFVGPRNPVEEVLGGIWSEVLGIEKVGVHDDFFNLGGHSIQATQLIFRTNEHFQTDVPLRELFNTSTIAGFAKIIEVAQRTNSSTDSVSAVGPDFETEVVLSPTITSDTATVTPIINPNSIFLTGSTGFLGTFLLNEFLQQTEAKLYCLVRAPDVEQGRHRIQKSLDSYSLGKRSLDSRIIPVLGDLSKPLLGLSPSQFEAMANKIDVICHNGAWVNVVYPYATLKAPNVCGTHEILRLACHNKIKPVHFISTVNIFSGYSHANVEVIREEDTPDHNQNLRGGYAQSKWIAETLVRRAKSRGIPVCIYRPARITGHSQTGACSTNDFLSRMIKGCIQIGSVPEVETMIHLTPVDYVSKAIVYLSKQKESLGKTFHLITPYSIHLKELIDWINSFGYALKQVSYDEWLLQLNNFAEHWEENALYPLLTIFSRPASENRAPGQTDTSSQLQFDCYNTINGLSGTSITCPPVDPKLLHTYFSYFIRNGFLATPKPNP